MINKILLNILASLDLSSRLFHRSRVFSDFATRNFFLSFVLDAESAGRGIINLIGFTVALAFSPVLYKAKLRKQGELCDYDFYAQFSGHASFL